MRPLSPRLGFCLLLFLAGCQSNTTKEHGSDKGTSANTGANIGTNIGTNAGGKVGRVAFVSNNAFDFWNIAEAGTKQASKDLGVEVVFKKPAKGTAEEQQQIIEDLVNTGIQGIAVSPNDAANAVDFFKRVSGKIPVVTQDSDLPDTTARRCYIGTHNYRAGRAVGELVAKAVPQGGKIAVFVGKLDVQNAVERRQGVLDYLLDATPKMEMGDITPKDAADFKVGKYTLVTTRTDNGDEAVCQDRAQELLLQHPDLVCVIGLWEYNPPALLRAVKGAKSKAIVVGFDENYQTLDAIKAGAAAGTVVQNPYEFGYQSAKILAGLAKGDQAVLRSLTDTTTKTPLTLESDNRIYIPHRVITKDNVDAFYAQLKTLKGS